jgi:4-hydroxy-tetrahydrodipicolinate synthase
MEAALTAPRTTHVISITTFDEQGNLDEDAYRLHLRRLRDAGVGVYVGGSSPGEGYSLSRGELETVYRIAREELKARVSVRAMGVEPRSAAQMLDIADLVAAADLDGMQIYSLDIGHGGAPVAAEIERYLQTVLDKVTMSVTLSSHQSGGYVIPLDVLGRILRTYNQISGVHITTPDIIYLVNVLKLVESLDHKVEVHTGGTIQAVTGMALGTTGFLSAEGNICPKLCASVIQHFVAGEYEQLFAAFRRLLPLLPINLRYGCSVRGFKTCMKVLGLPGWHLRAPLLAVDESQERDVEALLAAQGITDGTQ